jgi:hypothetical protein
MNTTTVIRLRKIKGKIVENYDVYIGRRMTMGGWNLPQSKWANPFKLSDCKGSASNAVERYKEYLNQPEQAKLKSEIPTELTGKILGCWCKKKPTDPCHGDILAEIANAKSLEAASSK